MPGPPSVTVARTEDLAPAFRLIFQLLPDDEREARVAYALEMVRQGGLEPEGIFVVTSTTGVLGALVCAGVPGGGGLIWPPQTVARRHREQIERLLVQHACSWLRSRGAKLAQALLEMDEQALGASLVRNGFTHVTNLWYMRHFLRNQEPHNGTLERLVYRSYDEGDQDVFQRTLLETYVDTFDCPEVNGVRDIAEIIQGHQSQGNHDPSRWWLALDRGSPVGVLLLTESEHATNWELVYLGLVPHARRQGLGREMTLKAIGEARMADITQLTLSVDARNRPAWNMYHSTGFEPFDQRAVYLAIWK